MLRPRWFVRSPHCGLGKVPTETQHYQSKLELSLPAQRDSPHWLPEFVDDVEVITRGDGTGGVQQIGLAAVRGRPNACELAMPLLIVQRTPVPAHARQPRKPWQPIPSGSMFLTIRWINNAFGSLDASVRRLFPRGGCYSCYDVE